MNSINPRSEWIDAILLEMVATHPYLSEEEEAAIKTRLFAFIASGEGRAGDAERLASRFRQARAER